MVLQGLVGGVRFLFLSDLGPAGQAALLERGRLEQGGIVVAGLPSRGEPLRDELIEAVRPELIVVADADWPMRERAGEALRERLAKWGARVLYTSDIGTVTLRMKNGQWQVRTMNSGLTR